MAPAKPKLEQPSFIERYSHMFAEDAASEPCGASWCPQRAEVTPHREEVALQPPLRSEVTVPAQTVSAAAEGDEESIEQYMAKLLQRVRGDSPVVASSQAPPVAPSQVVEPANGDGARGRTAAARRRQNRRRTRRLPKPP